MNPVYENVKQLSDVFLQQGYKYLRVLPGQDKTASLGTVAAESYLQILGNQLLPDHDKTEAVYQTYLLSLFPKGLPWGQPGVKVSFVQNPEQGGIHVSVVANHDDPIYLGEDPTFKVVLHHVVNALAQALNENNLR